MEEGSQGNLVYDSPMELDGDLCTRQGSTNSNCQGTYGLCCCTNILRMSGMNTDELQMIKYASTAYASGGFQEKLCTTGNADVGEKKYWTVISCIMLMSGIT